MKTSDKSKENMIYLDHASTTYVYPYAIDVVKNDLEDFWGNPSNNYKIGEDSKYVIDSCRKEIASLIGAKPKEIFFTSGASEGNAWALAQGRKCYCSPYEHHNITENTKAQVIEDGFFDNAVKMFSDNLLEAFPMYTNNVYSHMAVNNETGEIFPIETLFDAPKKLGMFTHCDCTQLIGNLSFNVKMYPNIDMITCSAHKFHGPKGIGFAWIREEVLDDIKPLIYGGIQQDGIRAGTENIAYIHAMTEALKIAVGEIESKCAHAENLVNIAINKLNESGVDYLINWGKKNLHQTFNFSLKDVESETIQSLLSEEHIYIGVGSACNTGDFKPSATLSAMNVPEEYIHGAIRLSFDNTTTQKDVETAMDRIIAIYKSLV